MGKAFFRLRLNKNKLTNKLKNFQTRLYNELKSKNLRVSFSMLFEQTNIRFRESNNKMTTTMLSLYVQLRNKCRLHLRQTYRRINSFQENQLSKLVKM